MSDNPRPTRRTKRPTHKVAEQAATDRVLSKKREKRKSKEVSNDDDVEVVEPIEPVARRKVTQQINSSSSSSKDDSDSDSDSTTHESQKKKGSTKTDWGNKTRMYASKNRATAAASKKNLKSKTKHKENKKKAKPTKNSNKTGKKKAVPNSPSDDEEDSPAEYDTAALAISNPSIILQVSMHKVKGRGSPKFDGAVKLTNECIPDKVLVRECPYQLDFEVRFNTDYEEVTDQIGNAIDVLTLHDMVTDSPIISIRKERQSAAIVSSAARRTNILHPINMEYDWRDALSSMAFVDGYPNNKEDPLTIYLDVVVMVIDKPTSPAVASSVANVAIPQLFGASLKVEFLIQPPATKEAGVRNPIVQLSSKRRTMFPGNLTCVIGHSDDDNHRRSLGFIKRMLLLHLSTVKEYLDHDNVPIFSNNSKLYVNIEWKNGNLTELTTSQQMWDIIKDRYKSKPAQIRVSMGKMAKKEDPYEVESDSNFEYEREADAAFTQPDVTSTETQIQDCMSPPTEANKKASTREESTHELPKIGRIIKHMFDTEGSPWYHSLTLEHVTFFTQIFRTHRGKDGSYDIQSFDFEDESEESWPNFNDNRQLMLTNPTLIDKQCFGREPETGAYSPLEHKPDSYVTFELTPEEKNDQKLKARVSLIAPLIQSVFSNAERTVAAANGAPLFVDMCFIVEHQKNENGEWKRPEVYTDDHKAFIHDVKPSKYQSLLDVWLGDEIKNANPAVRRTKLYDEKLVKGFQKGEAEWRFKWVHNDSHKTHRMFSLTQFQTTSLENFLTNMSSDRTLNDCVCWIVSLVVKNHASDDSDEDMM